MINTNDQLVKNKYNHMKTHLVCAIILNFMLSSIQAQIPTDSLIGYWPFNGNANDESGNGNHGTVNGATITFDRFGNPNSAYNFDGFSSIIEVFDVSQFDFSHNKQFSVSFFLKILDINNYGCYISKWGPSGDGDDEWQFFSNTFGYTSLIVNSTSKPGSPNSETGDTLNENQWYHIAGIWDGTNSTISFYVNGILINSLNSAETSTIHNSQPLRIGGNCYSDGFTNADIDDIRIFRRVLTPGEINSLAYEGLCFQTIAVTDTLIINTNLTSFSPIQYENNIKIYPNPTNDYIIIDNGNIDNLVGYQIKITNSIGQNVFQSLIDQQQFEISISSWQGTGIYFVYIIDGLGNIVDIKKIVLQ